MKKTALLSSRICFAFHVERQRVNLSIKFKIDKTIWNEQICCMTKCKQPTLNYTFVQNKKNYFTYISLESFLQSAHLVQYDTKWPGKESNQNYWLKEWSDFPSFSSIPVKLCKNLVQCLPCFKPSLNKAATKTSDCLRAYR